MDAHQDTPVSGPDSPHSQSRDGSTYGTPTEAVHSGMKAYDKDPQLVVGAGRSLKNMLVDLMSVLEREAKTKIFIQGDVTLRIEGREAYSIKVFNEDNVEPSNLKVRIESAPPLSTNGDVNRPQKRKADEIDLVSTANNISSPPKRARTDDAPTSTNASEEQAADEVMAKLNSISSQIKWVEECRRIAGESHDGREEKWRATSATFHDDARKSRERHETWMAAEMGWQRNMLIQLASDMKGLYPLTHSLKWETPTHLSQSSPLLPVPTVSSAANNATLKSLHNDNKPLGKVYTPKPSKPNNKGAASSDDPRR